MPIMTPNIPDSKTDYFSKNPGKSLLNTMAVSMGNT